MKKATAWSFAVACLLVMIVSVLVTVGSLRQNSVQNSPPLTLQELNRLAQFPTRAEPATTKKPSRPTQTEPASPSAIAATPPANLPHRLNRPATAEDRLSLAGPERTRRNTLVAALLGNTPAGGLFDALRLAQGYPDGASRELFYVHTYRREWQEAKRCLRETVRKADNGPQFREACAYLAWLEEDTELAARYMELAGSAGEGHPCWLNMVLAQRTGSVELAEYYESLYKASMPPRMKKQLDEAPPQQKAPRQ